MCLMRRHERKRGAKVTGDADPEGSSPEITALDMADSLGLLAGVVRPNPRNFSDAGKNRKNYDEPFLHVNLIH